MTEPAFRVRLASWIGDRAALVSVRYRVFVVEQAVPEELERDQSDSAALHFLAEDAANRPIGTARVLPDCRIGRMAVLESWRGKGVGSALLRAALEALSESRRCRPSLNAQQGAIGFYLKDGFSCIGEQFLEAGIVHRRMILNRYD